MLMMVHVAAAGLPFGFSGPKRLCWKQKRKEKNRKIMVKERIGKRC